MNISEKALNESKRILTPYTKSPDLLPAWTDEVMGLPFEKIKQKAFTEIAYYFGKSFIFETGRQPLFEHDFYAWEVDDLFGMPYTSSSDFATLWNTNTQARIRAKNSPHLYFKGVAAAVKESAMRMFKKFDFIFIFVDKESNYYYFSGAEFADVERKFQRLDRAASLAQFAQDVNEVIPKVEKVLTKYNGKKLGEKTRDKILEELREIGNNAAQKLNIWLNYHAGAIEFSTPYNGITKSVYINFYDDKNNIMDFSDDAKIKPLPEFDPVEALTRLNAQAAKVKEAAAALLPVIEEYNDAAKLLDVENISQYRADLYTLGKYGMKN